MYGVCPTVRIGGLLFGKITKMTLARFLLQPSVIVL